MARRAPPCDGVRPRHRPVVAAADRVVVARRSEADRRTEEGESTGIGRREDAGHGHRRLRPTQVDDLRPRDGGHRDGVALDRCVPLGADGSEEAGERRRERLPHQAEHGLLPRLPALEVAVHGEGAQERVLVAPLHGLRPQGQVLEGRGPRGRRGPRSPPTCRRRACPARPLAAPSRPAGRRGEAGGDAPRGPSRAPGARRAPRARRPRCASGGPSGRSAPARAGSRWRAPRRGRLPPRTTGTPSASRSILTGAPRPATARSPSICGRLARRHALRYAPPPPAARATAATVPPRTSGQRRRLSSRGTSVRPGPEGSPGIADPSSPGEDGAPRDDTYFAFDWLATASAAFFAASGSPR